MSILSEKKKKFVPNFETKEKMSSPKYSLNYFNKVGKVELCRLIFAASGVPYTDNCIENLTDSDFQFGLLPYLQVENETTQIPLISVISRFLAKEFNLAGESNFAMAKVDAIATTCMLLIDTYYKNVFNIEDRDLANVNYKAFLDNDVQNGATAIDKLIDWYSEESENTFAVGKSLTFADLFIFELASNYFPEHDVLFKQKFPNIYKIKANTEKNPRIADYLNSDKYTPHVHRLWES